MNFKKRKIRNNLSRFRQKIEQIEQEKKNPAVADSIKPPIHTQKNNKLVLPIIGAGVLIIFLVWLFFSIVSSLDFGSFILNFGVELKKDQQNRSNFLLLGTGDNNHDGANLTDSILVGSLNHDDNTVKMISLPRDWYIKDELTGPQRINKLYDSYLIEFESKNLALEEMKKKVGEILGLEIHYYGKVNFSGFVEIIDVLGGVEVNVEEAIYDPYYPLGETIKYTVFKLPAGLQTLDGETALKYARSRKTTSDFDRAKRQQQLIAAIKDKALRLELLTDLGRLQELYQSVSDAIQTDLSIPEILEMAKIARSINRDKISTAVFQDDSTSCGGLLYTPPREAYGGAAVLLEVGKNYQEIHSFVKNYLNYLPDQNEASIQVLNATKVPGLAGKYLNILSRQCLNVIYYGNASNRNQAESKIYYLPEEDERIPAEVKIIQEWINAPIVAGLPEAYLDTEKKLATKVIVEIGEDYREIAKPDPFDKIIIPYIPKPVTTTKPDATTATSSGPEPISTPPPATDAPTATEATN